MPNITLVTLNGIPGVDQASMTQESENSCGAYAIIAGVGALGVFPCRALLTYADAGPQAVNNGAITAVANNYTQLAAAAYLVTGILNPPGLVQPVVPELSAAGNAYNSPAAMAKVAIDLGRPAPRINVQHAGYQALSALYPGERGRCNQVVGAANVNVAAGNYAIPGAGETHLICVNSGGGALHWVAQGSNGNCYDPADGSLNNYWVPVNTGDAMGPYTFTGLWMVIS